MYQIATALGLLALCLFSLWHFPTMQVPLLISLLFYATVLIIKPHSWLIILPLVTVGLNLAPWSGRFISNEHDFFVLITIAVGLFNTRKQSSYQHGRMPLAFIFSVYCLLSLVSVDFGNILKPTTQNLYFASIYPFAITKGVLFALGLAWILKKQINSDKQSVINFLIVAAVLTSFMLFLIALWERKTIGYLFDDTPWMQVAHSFLNFSGAYRMTGIMADMHTGGESLDGIFLILAPINLLGVYWFKSHQGKAFALAGLLCLIYCVLVGFTRATYVAVALSLGALAGLQFYWQLKYSKNAKVRLPVVPLLLYIVYILSVWFAYSQAGYYTIAAGAIALLGTLLIKHFRDKLQVAYWPTIALLNIFVGYICIDSFYDSQWVDKSSTNLTVLTIALTLMLISALAVNIVKQQVAITSLYPHIAAIVIAAVIAVALGGTRIQMRMDTTSRDLDTRFTHWQSVLDSSAWSLKDILLGNGLGSFPINYVTSEPDLVRRIGSFTVVTDGFQNTLLLGPGEDLAFGQRLAMKPNTDYTIDLLLKSDSVPKRTTLHLSLCERNLIIFERWAVNCETKRVQVEPSSEYRILSTEINSGSIGSNIGIKRLPTVMLLRYKKGTAPLSIQSIKLVDKNGDSEIMNDNFAQGTDHWFFYHDFEHLPWHIKNIYLSIYYQLGVLGSFLFVLLLIFAAKNLFTIENETRPLNAAITGIILGYLAFGVFGDPLDSARVSSLFFMLLFYLASLNPLKTNSSYK
jgi:hypothetical protein